MRICVSGAPDHAQVSVLEMDGSFDKLEELIYVESHLSATSAKFYGEITQQLLKNSAFPGSNNGTGLFQTICGLKIREVYERVRLFTALCDIPFDDSANAAMLTVCVFCVQIVQKEVLPVV